MNTLANISGWIGNLFFILGAILVAKKMRSGFWCQIYGNFLYMIQGIIVKMDSLIILSLILIGINYYAIYYWKRDEK